MLGKGHNKIKTANMARQQEKKRAHFWFALFSMKDICFLNGKTFHSHLGRKSESNRYNWKGLLNDGLMLHFLP